MHPSDQDVKDKKTSKKSIPKYLVRLENIYDIQDKFKKVTNCKTNSSSMQYEVINLGIDKNPQMVNLGTSYSPVEKHAFISFFIEYTNIFVWTYDNLKIFDTNNIQHVMPMKPDTKPSQ